MDHTGGSEPQKVVAYLCGHVQEVNFMTPAQVARKLGISASTVVCLEPALGFERFKQMRHHLRSQLMDRLDTEAAWKGRMATSIVAAMPCQE